MKSTFTISKSTTKQHLTQATKITVKGLVILLFAFFSMHSVQAQRVYAVSASGNLISFDPTAPATVLSTLPLTGITTGQAIEGLDFRPATGQLYALGYNASNGETQVYTIKTATGVASRVGTAVTLATGMANISVDFNPVVDRIRVTSNTSQNYRLNPNNGALAFTDSTLVFAAADVNAAATPRVAAVGYTNNFAGATTTTLHFYDFSLNILGNINPPNNGILNTIGSSGLTANNSNGLDLDIITDTSTGVNTAYLSADITGTANNLYTVNLASGVATLVGTIGSEKIIEMAVSLPTPIHSKTIYAASAGNLITFNSATPGAILSTVAITGLGTGETILGMDFRPATGQLYALGSNSRLYTLNLTTAVATQVGVDGAFTLSGTKFGFDFNPVPDRIRVVSDLDQNLRLNPNDGTLASADSTLAFASGDVNGAANPAAGAVAYTNSFGGATATTLYFYDYNLDILGTVIPPNVGILNTVGSSALNFLDQSLDMDITTDKATGTNTAFLSANLTATATNFYRLNLLNSSVALVGTIGGGAPISAMAVYIAPVPPEKVIYVTSETGNLISFSSNTPGTIIASVPLTGITSGQVVEGLDFRPANGMLYALGYNASTGEAGLYTINTSTGKAISIGSTIALAINMGRLAVDFNPVVDRIRVIGSTGQNYRLNPNTGALAATDTSLSYAAGDIRASPQPVVHGAAYTNNFAGTTGTTLYYYDYNLDNLAATFSPVSPNSGIIATIGTSGLSTTGKGIDIDFSTDELTGVNTAFFTANVSDSITNFYIIDPATGEAKMVDTIGTGISITEMAAMVSSVPLPVTLFSFTAKKSGLISELSWTTQNELNNNYFIVERSSDGLSFTAISGKINSRAVNGTSTQQMNYSYTDMAPLKGINYYRLLQADKDGNVKYSHLRNVIFDTRFAMTTYPNPVKNLLNIKGNLLQNTTLNVKLTDGSGKTVLSRKFESQSGDWNQQINVSSLQSGMYYLEISDAKKVIHTQSIYKN